MSIHQAHPGADRVLSVGELGADDLDNSLMVPEFWPKSHTLCVLRTRATGDADRPVDGDTGGTTRAGRGGVDPALIAQNRSTTAPLNSIWCNTPWQKPNGSQKVSDESLMNVGL
jgi:hypothetical protein